MRLVAIAILLAACGGHQKAAPPPPDADTAARDEEFAKDVDVAVQHGDETEDDVDHPADAAGTTELDHTEAFDATTLSGEAVTEKIRDKYLGAMQRCYKQSLKADPTIEGALRIDLEVSEQGRATVVDVVGPSSELEACVVPLVSRWVFDTPRDDDGEPTTADFRVKFRFTTS